METRYLEVQPRTITGKEESGRIKRRGFIPAVFYGPGKKSLSVSVNPKELMKAIDTDSGENTLLTLKTSEVKELNEKVVIIKDWQLHPISKDLTHVDLYEIAMDKKITVEVPTIFKGKPKGVEEGGILQIIRREVEVECLPSSIPEKIEIDVSELEIGDAVHIEDITPPKGVTFIHEKNFTIVTVAAPIKEEEVAAPVEGVEGEVAAAEGEAAEGAKPGEAAKPDATKEGEAAKAPEKEKK